MQYVFQRTPEVEAAFQTATILDYLQPKERLYFDAESSNVGIGGMSSQVQEDRCD
jgi:hypothetical protein